MIVVPLRVESIGVFTGIEEQPDDLRVAVLRRQREGGVSGMTIRGREQPDRIVEPAEPGGRGEAVHPRAAGGEGPRGIQVPER